MVSAMNRFISLTTMVVAGLLIGCSGVATKASSKAAVEAAIADFNRQYLKAINDGDIVALSRLTTDDHIMSMPGRAPIVGKAANDAVNGRAFEQFKFTERWQPVETAIDGDLAYQRGAFTVDAAPKAGGEARHMSGNFLRIYKRQPDGSWKMTHDMFNSEQPATN